MSTHMAIFKWDPLQLGEHDTRWLNSEHPLRVKPQTTVKDTWSLIIEHPPLQKECLRKGTHPIISALFATDRLPFCIICNKTSWHCTTFVGIPPQSTQGNGALSRPLTLCRELITILTHKNQQIPPLSHGIRDAIKIPLLCNFSVSLLWNFITDLTFVMPLTNPH